MTTQNARSVSKIPPTIPLVGSTLLGLAASTAPADAQVVYTEITSGGTISAGQSLYFDLGETGGPGSVSNSSFGAADFRLTFSYSNSQKPAMLPTAPNRAEAILANNYVQRFDANATIGSGLNWNTSFRYLDYRNNPGSQWPAGQRGYIGLRIGSGSDFQYAWADVQYTASRQLTVFSFAVETTPNTAITASAVPEPKETALMMALLAGSVGLFARRQKARQN